MSKLRVNAFGIAIDGYGAGPDQDLANPIRIGGMALHQWVFGTKTFTDPLTARPPARPEGSTCDAGLDFGNTLICVDGECVACVPNAACHATLRGQRRRHDRRFGTCLVWEKKDDSGGIHDKDNSYTFAIQREFPIRDGTVFTEFLTGLNLMRFAGHGDWRLPTTDGLAGGPDAFPTNEAAEVETLHDASVPGCAVVASCIAPGFDVNCGEGSSGNPGCTVDGGGGEECSCAPRVSLQVDYWTNSTADPMFFGRGFTVSYTLAESVASA